VTGGVLVGWCSEEEDFFTLRLSTSERGTTALTIFCGIKLSKRAAWKLMVLEADMVVWVLDAGQ
jgi:hypothetical protein